MFFAHSNQQKEQMLSILVDCAQEIIATASLEGIFTSFNPAFKKITGFENEAWVGRHFGDLVCPEDLFKALGVYQTAVSGKTLPPTEIQIRSAVPNENKTLEITVMLRFLNGSPIDLVAIARDNSEKKKAEKEIAELNQNLERRVEERTHALQMALQELEAFSYSVSHDLRTPLRAISGFSTALFQDYHEQLPPEARHYLEVINKNAIQMGQLIDDLLALSRAGRQDPAPTQIDMNVLVRSIIEEFRQLKLLGGNSPVEISVNELPLAVGDPLMIRQVVANLLSNSVKFSRNRPNPRIEIGGDRESNENRYYVKDNGAGFDPLYSDKLFGVFQRLHSTDEFEGNGVGLAIVRRVIQRHGGRSWAKGSIQQGATFFFTLPNDKIPEWKLRAV